MRKVLIYLALFVLLLIAPSLLRRVQFFELNRPTVAAPPDYAAERIADVSTVPTPEAGDFVDSPSEGQGMILLDRAHDNEFTVAEIAYLDGRLAARGFELIPFNGGELATQLRGVNAFIVITPLAAFDVDEIRAVQAFVARGGRLLMVGDPTRFGILVEESDFDISFVIQKDDIPLNSLANEFDLIFNGDYLYNTVENEGNFRNIVLEDGAFANETVTEGLGKIAFYSAHSLQVGAGAQAILTADSNTWSSATDRPGGLVLAAGSSDGRVLGLGDIHFMIEPYHTVFDNGRFITQIADFLIAEDDRGFVLADFPYFFGETIDLVYTGTPDLGPDAFDEIITLQDEFRGADRQLQLAATGDNDHDVLYLGLYNQADEVLDILASRSISLTIDPPILTEAELAEQEAALEDEETDEDAEESEEEDVEEETADDDVDKVDEEKEEEETPPPLVRLIQSQFGNVQMSGTSLILLHEAGSQRQVIALAASADGLESVVGRLLQLVPLSAEYALADCLVQEMMALCPTNVSDEEVDAELISGGMPGETLPDDEPTEDEEPPDDEPEDPDIDITDEDPEPFDLDFVEQGPIAIDEIVVGSLLEEESHGWIFTGGPATIDILMESEELDGVIEVYGPDDEYIDSADAGLSGEPELLEGIVIEDDQAYTIIVRDFWSGAGEYTLSVTTAATPDGGGEESSQDAINSVFIFADDNGEALNGGITSATFFADQLESDYDVVLWVSSTDGPLSADILEGIDLFIWDSGDYRDEEGFLDEDTATIFEYLDTGEGGLLLVGSSPTLFSYLETSPISDIEISGDDPILLAGLEPGSIWSLDQTYDAIIPDFLEGEDSDDEIAFLLRGPDSDFVGSVVGVVSQETTLDGQKSALIIFPFTALPVDIQATLFQNIMAWFELGT